MAGLLCDQQKSRVNRAMKSEQIDCPRDEFAIRSLNDYLLSRFHFNGVLTPNDEITGPPWAQG